MTKTQEALKLALEALDHNLLFTSLMPGYDGRVIEKAYKAINKALAEQPAQQQEPVAYLVRKKSWAKGHWECAPQNTPDYGRMWADERMPVYTSPPPAQRKPLTDEQIDAAVKAWFENDIVAGRPPFAKRMRAAIESAHGIKENT